MNANDFASLFDGGLSEHWPDLLMAALLAVIGGFCTVIGYFLKRDISGMDKRHERAEDKFEKIDDTLGDHRTRITLLEKSEGKNAGKQHF
jgi:hypothetical protein